MKIVRALISVFLVATVLATGCATGQPPISSELTIPSVARNEVSNPKLIMGSCYGYGGLSISRLPTKEGVWGKLQVGKSLKPQCSA